MKPSVYGELERLLRDNGLTWMIDSQHRPPDEMIKFLVDNIEKAHTEARSRLGDNAPQITVEALSRESIQNPHKARAFLQALGATRSPQMLVMVRRILKEAGIQQVDMIYRERAKFHLRVVLNSPYEDQPETYESTDIDDASLLRHLGIMKIDGAPLFDGFYSLRIG